ncbi:hypothetical protein UFOVP116_237 [uncultured Caudovirales phage]|uniref:Uncharacterized protein n=1 Tax=uncultured Caudovirales phage TaxID=2100421 RepID=A0A6J5L7P5_9CAUD|nr:hypothetical protein UFOVP116_237 [uncultured Caudovirales phage]
MNIEMYFFLGWIVTVFVAVSAYRDRSELYAEAMADAAKAIAKAIKQTQAEKPVTSETSTDEERT